MGVLLYPGFELLDVMGLVEWVGFMDLVNIKFISKDGKSVAALQNITVVPDYSFANAPAAFDIVLVPGGPMGAFAALNDPMTVSWIQ